MQQRRLILITNDDGINAPGLMALADCVKHLGDLLIVAPDEPQSGMSSAISVNKPLKITDHGTRPGAEGMADTRVLSVSGTPVDCVKLALHILKDRKPDLLFSGINHGSNSGTSITYSGTMGTVLEGCMAEIPSVGFSLLHHSLKADFSLSAQMVTDIATKVARYRLPIWTCLNVNIPALITPKGIRCCRAARGHWTEEYKDYLTPYGQPFYWLTGKFVNSEPDATDTDEYWLDKGYISVVPVTPDQSEVSCIKDCAKIFDE